MKLTIFSVIFALHFSLTSEAAPPPKKVDCERVADTARVFCETLEEMQCQDLHSCLKRRDSCVEKGNPPTSKEACEDYNLCLKEVEHNFSQRCTFSWGDDYLTGAIRCIDNRSSFWRSTSCPGYAKGNLLRAFTLKEENERDINFDCSLANREFLNAQKKCSEAIEEYTELCLIGSEDKVKVAQYKQNLKCEYSEKFNEYQWGHFSLDKKWGARVINDGRKRAPIKDEGAGGGQTRKGSGSSAK